MSCPIGSDDQFGPRVISQCRPFDFTLLFEDAIFAILPAGLFLVLAAFRATVLIRGPVKVTSHRLATWKLIALAHLLVFHIVQLAFQVQTSLLHTKASLAASLLQVFAVAIAVLLSWLRGPTFREACRFDDSIFLYIKCLGASSNENPVDSIANLTVTTFLVLCLESIHKTQTVRLAYRESSKESTSSFWVRSFFIWVIPLFRTGFSTILSVHDMPDVDRSLQGDSAKERLQIAWAKSEAN
ncbi:hypothetical protein N7526_011010 [Penicillium atrosanguineum]|nr:hypothetical protein N7526_011010 [Penicillium atrosanguineum]